MTDSNFARLLQEGIEAYARHDAASAASVLAEALAVASTTSELGQIARLHRRFGRLGEYLMIHRRIIETAPNVPDSYLQLALADAATSTEVDSMVRLYDESADPETKAKLGFALGKVFQDAGDFERSYAYYDGANAAHRSTLTYSVEEDAADLHEIASTFTSELFAKAHPRGIRCKNRSSLSACRDRARR